MKILFLNDRLTGGGTEKILQILTDDLAARGHRVTVLSFAGSRGEFAAHYPASVRFYRLPFRQGGRLCRVWETLAGLLPLRWDVGIAMKEGPCMRLASRLRVKRKLAWVHTDPESLHWSRFFFRSEGEERACMARFDRVVCVSETVRRNVVSQVGDPGNLCVRLNPIPVQEIEKKAAQAPADAVRPLGKPLLLAVGRLDKSKRLDLLLDCCGELRETYDFALWIVGGGSEEEALRRQVEREHLDFARLLGSKENPYPYLRRADWLVSASGSESYGLALQEALILDVPVIACACPAIEEHLDPLFGVLVGLAREDLLAGLREILEHPELQKKYRRNLRRYQQKEKLWEPRLEAIRSLIEKGV